MTDATAKDSLPKGLTCACGHYEAFSMWVYAHWCEPINHECPKCKAKYIVIRGVAKPCKRRAKK